MKSTTVMVAEAPLSKKEIEQRARLEHVIAQAERGFWDIGKGLREIREGRLYRPGSWEKYCASRWDRPHDWADEHIRASKVMDNLHARKSAGKFRELALPGNISQALALAGLEAEKQWEVWRQFEGMTATVASISRAVEKLTGKPPDAEAGEISEELAAELQYLPPDKRLEVLKEAEQGDDDPVPSRSRSRSDSGLASWLANVLGLAARLAKLIDKRPADWEGDPDEAAKRLKKLTELFEE